MNRIVAALLLAGAAVAAARADTYGRHERVRVQATPGIEIVGRLDPAAPASLLAARDVKYFNRQGGMWVRFTIDNGGVLAGSRLTLERPLIRDQKLRQRDGSIEHRPLVALALCIGRAPIEAALSLSERSGYTAPLVLGAPEIARLGAVDAAREYTIEPSCGDAGAATAR
ncbi:MAG: RimK/LysX family protein [Gammaproteobacteria bacterium]|nr:RimK/LysX family protein [Gammaproteobacteria bacterium]